MRIYGYERPWGGTTRLIVTIDNGCGEDCKRKTTIIDDWRRAKRTLDLLNKYPGLLEKEEFTSSEFYDIVNGERSKGWLLDVRNLKIFNMLSDNRNIRVRLGDYPNCNDEDMYPIFKKVREEKFKIETPKYNGMGTRYYFAVDEEGVEILEDYVNMFAPCLVAGVNNKILKEQEKLERLQKKIEQKTKKIANLLETKALLESGEI